MKWLRRSAGVLEIVSSGSVTCCNRKPRFASKTSRKPCGSRSGSVSMALLTTSLCPFLPHAREFCGEEKQKNRQASATTASLPVCFRDKPCIPRFLLRAIRRSQSAVLPAVERIKYQPYDHPHKESDPIHDRQARHEQDTGNNRKDRRNRPAWCTESTR